MKILNLYAGIGGNRKLWGDTYEITAIELDKTRANIYKDLFPKDTLIIADAHEYLLNHYKEYDFIWSSPPCQTHSSFRHNICVRFRGTKAEYPDMKLYQEVLFLKHHFSGEWVVENVKPYYEPLISPDIVLQRHYFWSNITIPYKAFDKDNIRKAQIPDFERIYGYDLSKYKIKDKRQTLRNCVSPELGKYILGCFECV
jgi:DNA (cytosine-5)-methyltransferase 1